MLPDLTGVGRTGREAVPQLQVELRDGVRLLRAFQADPLSAAHHQGFALRRQHGARVLQHRARRDADARRRQRLLLFGLRSEEHTSELQSLMRISYAVFCLKKKKKNNKTVNMTTTKILSMQKTNT